ncbi:enediyne antibiotic chromoprotein [Planotetraspora sp. GP83]|uniref:enediyne antibiotic chromoprotein n=1 Tax=Planotetraspora sp. GP83 TaxID=3156264 RepID=UPI003516F902
MIKKTSLLSKLGVATAVMVGGLTLASQPSAFAAAAPSFSVTPSTGLSDGNNVTVSITGAGPGEKFSVIQCATVNAQLACNGETAKTVTADASGSVSSSFVVRRSFQGTAPESGTPVGPVDCATTACYVSAGNQSVFLGSQPISFS